MTGVTTSLIVYGRQNLSKNPLLSVLSTAVMLFSNWISLTRDSMDFGLNFMLLQISNFCIFFFFVALVLSLRSPCW